MPAKSPGRKPKRPEKARPVQQMQLFGLPKMVMPTARIQPVERLVNRLVSNKVIFKTAGGGKVDVHARFAGHLQKFMMQPGTNAGKLIDYLVKEAKIGGFSGLGTPEVKENIIKHSGAIKPIARSKEEQNALNEHLGKIAYWVSYSAAVMPIVREIKRQAASSRPRGIGRRMKPVRG